ncbi:hypothetical protein Lxx18910 [Leifsonia xyli subsp. xyli str. CTCB07]|uniref:PqqD family protein n=1 Tax=Leifsonia xyli subsp. xyli (strain CTCB07) TaxID=281090 RepID=Q6ADC3_LEIXX|nr:PqqD family protein [Leifsonia xyli]AAT89621.1 hypothetical protein Lxx18910 [Leifsonia xyli subsp. xyli str. CTCB07]
MPVPNRAFHAAIALLHAHREADGVRRAGHLDPLVAILRRWNAAERAELGAAVERIGAAEVLAETCAELGVAVRAPDRPSGEMLVWRLRRSDTHHAVDWMLEVLTAPRRERIAVLRNALFPPREDVMADHPEQSASFADRLRLRRGGRAMRSIPKMLQAIRVARSESVRRAIAESKTPRLAEPEPALTATEAPAAPVPAVEAAVAEAAVADADAPPAIARSGRIAAVADESGDYLLALDRLGEPPMVLAGSASLIWRVLDAVSWTPEGLVLAVASAAGMEPDLIRGDVAGFLATLRRHGLVEEAAAASANAGRNAKNSSPAAASAPHLPAV